MTVKDFVEAFKAGSFDVSKHITTKYLPYAEKMAEAREIAERSTHIKENGQQIFYMNTPMQFHLLIQRIIARYTDIEIENPVEDFDTLNEAGAIDAIVQAIPQREYAEFDTIVKMSISDIMENERSFAGFLDTKFNALKILFDSVLEDDQIKEAITSATQNIVQFPTNENE